MENGDNVQPAHYVVRNVFTLLLTVLWVLINLLQKRENTDSVVRLVYMDSFILRHIASHTVIPHDIYTPADNPHPEIHL